LVQYVTAQLEQLDQLVKFVRSEEQEQQTFKRSNIFVKDEVDLMLVDLALETGFVFAMLAKQAPEWIVRDIARALHMPDNKLPYEQLFEQVSKTLMAWTCEERFWKTWLLDREYITSPTHVPTFENFKEMLLDQYHT
jgi:hypothetical protein